MSGYVFGGGASGSGAVTSVAGKTGVVTLTAGDVTGDAPLASPTFTGTPVAPTAAQGTNTTQVATTAMVHSEAVLLAPLASPTLTGTPTLPTGTIAVKQTAGDNSTKVATTSYTDAAVGKTRADIANAAAGLVSQPFDVRTAASSANPASQTMYGALTGFKAGDVITNIVVLCTTVGTVSAAYGVVYNTANSQLAVSANFNASWIAGYDVIPMGTPYTVPADAALYLSVLLVWSVQPVLVRGISSTIGAIGSGAKLWTQQTAQATPPATVTWGANGINSIWIAAS